MNGTSTGNNTFFGVMDMAWLEDKVAITFHTDEPIDDPTKVINSLRLKTLNAFLDQRGFVLQSSTSLDVPSPLPPDKDNGDKVEDKHVEEENPLEAFLEELTEGGVEAIQKRFVLVV